MLKSSGHFRKWKERAVNLTLSATTRIRTNTFSMIAPRKLRAGVEVFAMTEKRFSHGKKISQKGVPLMWLVPWALSFYRKSNIESCSDSEISTPKHRAG